MKNHENYSEKNILKLEIYWQSVVTKKKVIASSGIAKIQRFKNGMYYQKIQKKYN